MPATDLERLVIQLDADVSRLNRSLDGVTRSVDQAMNQVERRASAMSSRVEAAFSRIGAQFAAFLSARRLVAFGRDIFENFDKIAEKARGLGIAVDQDLVAKMHAAQNEWEKAWLQMELAVAPTVAAVAQLLADLPKLPAAIKNAFPHPASGNIGITPEGQVFGLGNALRQGAADAGVPFAAGPSLHDKASAAGFPLATNTQFLEAQKQRAKAAEDAAKRVAEVQKRASEVQKQIDTENAQALVANREKIKEERFAASYAETEYARDQAAEQLAIDNANFSAIEGMRQKILDETVKAQEQGAKILEQEALESQRIQEQVTANIVDGFADLGAQALTTSDNVGEAFRKMALALTQYIIKLELAKAIESSLGKGGGGIVGFLGGLFGGGGGFPDTVPITPGLFGGARAGGGPVSAGMLYRVNESGQEFFRPSVPGNIIPAGRTSGARTVNVNVYQTISGNGDAALAKVVRSAALVAVSQMKQHLPEMITDAQMRTG